MTAYTWVIEDTPSHYLSAEPARDIQLGTGHRSHEHPVQLLGLSANVYTTNDFQPCNFQNWYQLNTMQGSKFVQNA